MDISQRLKTVASMVKFDTMTDIGTDHGYVPIYLVKNNVISSAIACDVNSGPLQKAKINISSYKMDDKIQTRLGSGLVPIKCGEVETAVIAGMGGMLIIDILEYCLEVTKSIKQLVLQPQLDVDKVRKYIHSIGFMIEDEKMVFEENKFYTVLSCVKGEEVYEEENHYAFGKILLDRKDPILKQYVIDKINRLENIAKELKNLESQNATARYNEAMSEIKFCQGVLKCL